MMARPTINREHELARLGEAVAQSPQLAVIRGRRRVGKSFLLSRAFEQHRAIYFQADQQTERDHLDLFAQEVARLLPGQPPLRFDGWEEALRTVGDMAGDDAIVVVLDEFQWLWKAQPSLDSIIQRHWDAWERAGTKITLVLSGSALTLMESLLEPASPLYGRANYRPLILPLDYRRAAEFADGRLGAEQRLRRYAVLGGTPQYQVWAGTGSIESVVRDRILTKGESLYEEPLHLLREEQSIRDPSTYFSIVAAIAGSQTRLGEISNRTQIPGSNLSTMLGRLEDLGYVEAITPVTVGRTKEKHTHYRLRDPFFRFWFRYVFPRRSQLEREQVDPVIRRFEADFDNYMGLAFEACCRDWVGRYAPEEGRAPHCERIGSWWSRDGQTEIDIVGTGAGSYALLGSCKWSQRAGVPVLTDLLDDQATLGRTAARADLFIFARGFDPALEQRAAQEDVKLITASALFA